MPQLNFVQGIIVLFNFLIMATLTIKLIGKALEIKSPIRES